MALSTTSFVTEVLASAGKFEREDLNAKLGRLSNRIDVVKVQVYESLRKQYGHFEPSLYSVVDLAGQYQSNMEEMSSTCTHIQTEIKNQLDTSTVEFAELSSQLAELSSCLSVVGRLVQIHAAQESADSALAKFDFTTVAASINSIEHILTVEAGHEDKNQEIDILQRLHKTHQKSKADLIVALDDCWQKNICWNFKKSKKNGLKDVVTVEGGELRVCASEEGRKTLMNAVQAMHDMHLLTTKLNNFGNSFHNKIIKPIVAGQEYKKAVTGGEALILIQPPKNVPEISTSLKLSSLQSVFNFLHNHLLQFKVCETDGNRDVQKESVSLMRFLGEQIAEEVLQFIIKECLAPAVPTSHNELEQYKGVIQLTEALQKTLLDLEFITPGNIVLLDYVQNINVHSSNKKCQEILEKARHLMTSDLFNTVAVSPDEPFGDLVLKGHSVSSSNKAETSKHSSSILPRGAAISANTFRLPACKISLTVQKLVVFAYEMLHEATTSSAACAVQLFYSVSNMFELFCCVVPTFHKASLTTIPQLAAIHHNNCMYVAHHMMTMGHQFSAKLPAPLNSQSATFVHLVPKMRRLGAECFLQMMTVQKNQMVEFLAGTQGFMNVSESGNQMQAVRAVNQCLVQLDHLSHVWREVLPACIYQKAIGTLINSILLDIITCVIMLEDISADDTSVMSTIFTTITDKVPSCISVEENNTSAGALLLKHVQKWQKFTELHLLLTGNLQSILDRWAEGKGPLAAHFTSNEVKQLIRALFQNTDRRAAVLAKIR